MCKEERGELDGVGLKSKSHRPATSKISTRDGSKHVMISVLGAVSNLVRKTDTLLHRAPAVEVLRNQ